MCANRRCYSSTGKKLRAVVFLSSREHHATIGEWAVDAKLEQIILYIVQSKEHIF
jgi:hypothetical protein